MLTHWGRVTHICVSKLATIGSDNGLSPDRRQAIIWSNAGILLIRTIGTNFSEILSEIHAFSLKKMHSKMASAKWRPFCLGLNVLNTDRYLSRLRLKQCLLHWDRDKMDAISQTTFSSAFSWMRMYVFRLKFHWSLFLRVQLTVFKHWFR